jgi:energy-coupling factor transporter ATP-binding protein EcfA2/ubiquinone/menaquinone biosynthesis C-methylase UbiE
MKITAVNLPISEKLGLKEIKMDRLGQVVLLSGKNGSGKSRILSNIFDSFKKKPTKHELILADRYKAYYRERIDLNNSKIDYYAGLMENKDDVYSQKHIQGLIDDFKNDNIKCEKKLDVLNNNQNWTLIETNEEADEYIHVEYNAYFGGWYLQPRLDVDEYERDKKYVFNRIIDKSFRALNKLAEGIDNPGLSYSSEEQSLAKIQIIQDRWVKATNHVANDMSESEKTLAIEDYKKLNEILKIFFNVELSRIDDFAAIFGAHIEIAGLSIGQQKLLQYCVAIHSQKTLLKDMILVLDEPETNLHPSALIQIVNNLQKIVTNGQIWIATHSIPLLAHFDPACIWYVEDGGIRYAGKIPEKVLSSLLGDEEEISRLYNFIGLPAQFALSKYAFECLFESKSLMTKSLDTQSMQIRSTLLAISSNGKLRVLDYGAGKGRFISNIMDFEKEKGNKLLEQIDYIAFDKNHNDKDECCAILKQAYGTFDKKYYNDFASFLSDKDEESFDVVIMCNVFHEIDPKEWLRLFGSGGEVSRCLTPRGFLLLVEDYQMAIGEKAYQNGFLVLNTPELKRLFKISEKDADFEFEDKGSGVRLKYHLIPKRLLLNIDENSRHEAIELLSKLAGDKILEIRNREASYKNGNEHGFWIQQYANAQLCMAEL